MNAYKGIRLIVEDACECPPGSPEYDKTKCGPKVFVLSTSDFILTMDLAAVVSDATITYPFPTIPNEHSILSDKHCEKMGSRNGCKEGP